MSGNASRIAMIVYIAILVLVIVGDWIYNGIRI
jgi:hypothetical protein